jgi:thioredoxin-like negative regulator of GroEL
MTNSPFIDDVTERDFGQRVLRSEVPALVVVWGNGADEPLLNLLEEWASQTRCQLGIFRLSDECSPRVAERFDVPLARGLALFNRGALCYQFIGEASRHELEELLARASTLGRLEDYGGTSAGCILQPPQNAK